MRLTRLHLRNYRVYEDPLDIDVPPGLIGVYGVNGAGKSTLLEAILFTLWGRARTGKDDVRTSGVGGDCVAEVEFEHEGHLYLVRRTLSGVNATAKAEAHCDRLLMAEGVRDTGRYVHQVLGMDDIAFRASVFAEQKQLAAFSSHTPSERRRLVLQLLGITPLDSARDAARKDAREARERHDRLRELLPDLDVLRQEADDADARAAALSVVADEEDAVAAGATARAAAAESAFGALDRLRQAYEALVLEGRAARAELNGALGTVKDLEAEQADLDLAADQLAAVAPVAAGLPAAEAELSLVGAVVGAEDAVGTITVAAEPPPPDDRAFDEARAGAEQARAALAAVTGRADAVSAELTRARERAGRSVELSGEEACPLCGQALGDAFEQVRTHRAAEVTEAEARLAGLEAEQERAAATAAEAVTLLETRTAELQQRARAHAEWERDVGRRADAEAALTRARQALAASSDAWAGRLAAGGGGSMAGGLERIRAEVAAARDAAATAERLQGRLERGPAVAELLDRARLRVGDAEHRLLTLLDKVRDLDFDAERLARAQADRDEAAAAAERASRSAVTARMAAERERALADSDARRLAEAHAQHDKLADLAGDVVHLGRAAELLNSFRNAVVATVGPRLAVQAAELFGELTDHEYDRLEVDPETYELQVSDAGRLYGMDRLSGSEIDLANLALRVAISEHVRFQSGGIVGLLVLDEVFGPLDEDRKARMLLALERLRGRFRQIIVVTHAPDIKEQLPNAIEVVKRPGRRATARLLHD
jgi:exonuclease SbcC